MLTRREKTAEALSQIGARHRATILILFVLVKLLTSRLPFQNEKTVAFDDDLPGTFPFLKLPPEIRTMIYRLCVVTKDRFQVPDLRSLRQPAIMRLCQTTRQETLAIFYCENCFTFNLHLRDPASEPPKEEHQWLKFIRAIKLLSKSPYFQYIQELEIVAILHGYDKDVGGANLEYGVRILRDRPRVCAEEEMRPSIHDNWYSSISGEPILDTQELRPGDWGNIDLVHQAVETQLLYWRADYLPISVRAITLGNARISRLCEVLSLLLGQSRAQKHVFG